MDFFSVMTMVGGLALFLYGMHLLGEGLSKASGGRLEKILESLTSSKWKAVLLGCGVTAVIQSSSATTVMVVGFVNSGIMKLNQAVGVIMGANIGTTVTSWILSLSGIQSDQFVIRLLKPTSFSPVLAFIGVMLVMFAKQDKKKNVGMILVGFAILMTGMDTMSEAVKPLSNVPEFTGILTMFSNPILGMLAGAVLTAAIQSSSASVGILQALCVTGAVPYSAAIPIIMGQNIGTCVTAMLSGIGASKNAKRTACIHLYFNLIGTIVFMILFYTINAFVPFRFLDEAANGAGIAVIHSCFNIFATILLYPFANLLVKLACVTVRDDTEKKTNSEETEDNLIRTLDPRFLNQPALAMEHCRRETVRMAEIAREALYEAMSLLKKYDEAIAEDVQKKEAIVDHYEDALGTYMVKLSAKQLSAADSQSLSILLHCIGNFERISDHAVNIMMSVREMQQKGLEFSDKAKEELSVYVEAISGIMNISLEVFEREDMTLALQVEPLEEVIDGLHAEIQKRHIKRLRKGKCTIELGFVLSDITTAFERIADHCSNVAVSVLQIKADSFEVHEYIDRIKKEDSETFDKLYKMFKETYHLKEKEKAAVM